MPEDNSFFETMLDNLDDGVFILDDKGNYVYVNSSYIKIAGTSKKKLLSLNVFNMVKDGQIDRCIAEIVYREKRKIKMLQDVNNFSNQKFQQIVTSTPIFDSKGNVKNILSIAKPIYAINNEYRDAILNAQTMKVNLSEDSSAGPHFIPQEQQIVAESPQMKELLSIAATIAAVDSAIIISGESGTGKEVIAHYIHEKSARSQNKLVEINCASFPENLLEAELFGYERGAFTGALTTGKKGIIEEADKGTLFLDEINSLPLNLQGKLLRVLETKMVQRIGSTKEKYVDFRLLTATNVDLKSMVDQGTFRADLYYRLNVVPIIIPPLRERKEDIVPLTVFYLKKFGDQYGRAKSFSQDVIKVLLQYSWPGNVRELKNFVERMVVMSHQDVYEITQISENMLFGNIEPLTLEQEKEQPGEILPPLDKKSHFLEPGKPFPLRQYLDQIEQTILKEALEEYGSTHKAAKALGISQSGVIRRKEKFHMK